MNPSLSIVIPTRNRYKTLIPLVEKLMLWPGSDFEVVVQDNSPDNTEFIHLYNKYKNDSRLRYNHVAHQIPVLDNFQQAIEISTGSYVCFLGDDDGLIFQAVAFARWMKENDIDSLNCKHGSYCWPDYRFKNHGKKLSLAGMLISRKFSGTISKIDPVAELNYTLEAGATFLYRLPRVYHGMVSRKSLEEVKAKAGTYFPGPVADMASAVALVFCVKKHIYLDFPLIVAGASGHSTAGRGGQFKSYSKIEDEKTLPANTARDWSPELPRFWSPQTIWPEGALQALNNIGKPEFKKRLNLARIFAELIVDIPPYRRETYNFIKETTPPSELRGMKIRICKYIIRFLIAKLRYRVKTWAVFCNMEKLLGLTLISADHIGVALTGHEQMTETYLKESNSDFAQAIRTLS